MHTWTTACEISWISALAAKRDIYTLRGYRKSLDLRTEWAGLEASRIRRHLNATLSELERQSVQAEAQPAVLN